MKSRQYIADFVGFFFTSLRRKNSVRTILVFFLINKAVLNHSVRRLHPEMSGKLTLSLLDLYWRRAFGVSVHSRNKTSQHGPENRILTEIQNSRFQKSRLKIKCITFLVNGVWSTKNLWLKENSVVSEFYVQAGRTVELHCEKAAISRGRKLVPFARQCPWSSTTAKDFLPNLDVAEISQPPYSPDLAPADFSYSPK
jgi:hypothetical protein